MQYIQLQGQVAEALDTPINGGYNLFIDTADNSIKAKDENGNLVSTNGLVEITKTQLDAHILSGSLTTGTFYKITGVASGSGDRIIQEGGTTIILQAASTSSLNPKGVGLFWNPKYYNPTNDLGEYDVWNPTFEFQLSTYYNNVSFDMEETIICDAPCNITLRPNILDNTMIAVLNDNTQASFFLDTQENYPIQFYGDNTGITGSLTGLNNPPTTFTSGSKVIWGGRVWGNLNGNLGTNYNQYELNEEDWVVIPYNSTNYNLVANVIEYDYQNNNICYRKDTINNIEVFSNWWEMDGNDNYIRTFPWGHPQIHNVSLGNTFTDNLINFPNYNEIDGLYMKSNTRFGANYWGKYNRFYDIIGETNSRISNLSLGKWGTYRRIQLGINSNIGGNGTMYIVGNDGNTITDITLGNTSNIYNMEMFQYSYLDNIRMGDNSSINSHNMRYDTSIRNIDMGLQSGINGISFGNGAYLNNINLDASAYIGNLNLDINAELYNISLGRNSYIDYSSLEANCSIYDISLGVDAYMNCNTLYNTDSLSSTMNNISLGDNSSISTVQLYGSTYITNINASNNSGFNSLTITGSNTYLSDFEMEQNSGFGSFTIDGTAGSISFNNFKIGQNNGFGGLGTVTQTKSNITIQRGFSNWDANELVTGVTGSLSWNDRGSMTQLNTDKSFQILSTYGWDAGSTGLHYYLPNGEYDGQVMKFFMTTDGVNINNTNIGNLAIWMDNIAPSYNLNSSYTALPWYPFSTGYPNFEMRKDIPQCVWINGKWVIDNDAWD